MNKIHLTRQELDKINNVLHKLFGDNETTFILTEESSSGIGSILTLSCDYLIDNIKTTLNVEISGVETW